jgi:hypothetical protein
MQHPKTPVEIKTGVYIRKCISLAVSICLAAMLCLGAYVYCAHSFDDYRIVPIRQTPSNWFTHVKVGIIGDSWVAGKKLDELLKNRLMEMGLNAEVVSSGHPGAKSRQIYRDLFADEGKLYSTKSLLLDDDLDYLVIIGGVNDTIGHIGPDNYAHHMLGIIKAAQERSVQPLVVEVPEYGIECTSAPSIITYCKRILFRYLFDGGKLNVIDDYRKELLLQITKLAYPVTVIHFNNVVRDYASSTNLYLNPSHLNQEGNSALASLIAGEVIELHNKTIQRTGGGRLAQ